MMAFWKSTSTATGHCDRGMVPGSTPTHSRYRRFGEVHSGPAAVQAATPAASVSPSVTMIDRARVSPALSIFTTLLWWRHFVSTKNGARGTWTHIADPDGPPA